MFPRCRLSAVLAERKFLGERVTYVFDVRMTRLKKPAITSPFVCDQGEPEVGYERVTGGLPMPYRKFR
jgi:hypothetical protein